MTKRLSSVARSRPRRKVAARAAASALVALSSTHGAYAGEIATGNDDVKVRWDNTVKYSASFRTTSLDPRVSAGSPANPNPNVDDGDHNFKKGLISNRFDLLSEFDASYRNLGVRVSGAAWYDTVYNRSNDNDSPTTFNAASVPNTEFTEATKKLHGRKAEFLDSFVFGKFNPGNGDTTLTLRAGRFTQLYGESLFFGSNGIAAAQSTPDVIKLLSVPSSQFKEILRPVGQIAGQLQISPQLSIGAYYQYEWRKARLPASGSYFSFADFMDDGGERVILGPPLAPGAGSQAFYRGSDFKARDSGQGGLQLKSKVADWEFGLYAAQFHDKFPQVYFRPGAGAVDPTGSGQLGEYALVYGQNIKAFGASASTVFGSTNVAAEVSYRRNMPLTATGGLVVDPTLAGNGRENPLYPVGNTFHAQLSAVAVLPATAAWDGASFMGEVAFNRRLSITKNAGQLDPNATRDATALRFIFQPEYFQVVSGIDLQVPFGLGYGLKGRSSVNGIGFPAEHGGDLSLGVRIDYLKTLQASLTYTHFLGRPGAVINSLSQLSFDQMLKDRNFISFSLQTSF